VTTTARPAAPPSSGQRPAARDANAAFTVPTAFGALAVIGGATALTPLITGWSWLIPIAEVVAVIWLVGVGARLVGAPPWTVSLLQVVAFACGVTGLHLSTGIGGILPWRAAVGEAVTTVHVAWEQIRTTVPPMSVTPELGFFVTLTIGAVAVVVDQLIAGSRAPALVALPLLGLYSVPAAIASDLLPWFAFVLPAASYAAVLATSEPRTGRLPRRAVTSVIVSSVVIGVAAIGAAVALSDAAVGIGTDGRLPHTGGPSGEVGLSPWARLRGDLTDLNPVDMARVEGMTAPQYLRTFALEKWEPDSGFVLGAVHADSHNIDGSALGDQQDASDTVTITPAHYRDKYLPIFLGASAVQGLGSGWNFDAALRTVFRSAATTPAPYSVVTATTVPAEAELRADTVSGHQNLTVTGELPTEVTRLAQRLTAGATNAFDQVDALLNFFTDPANGFTYSLRTPPGDSGDALVDFLSNRVGYCEQYAATMAIMVRSLGIPARVGMGFTQGAEQADGSNVITSNNAHAWVEVPYDGAGWVIFDPTPSVNGQGGLQGFAVGDAEPGQTTGTSVTPTDSTAVGATTTASSAQLPGATVTRTGAAADSADSAVSGWVHFLRWAGLVVLVAAVLLLAGAAPSLLRSARRRRRLALAAGRGPGAASAAWQEIVDTAIDHNVDIGVGDSARQIANRIAQRAGLAAPARDRLRTVVTHAELDWYSGDSNSAPPDLAPGVRAVITGLQHALPMPRRSRWWPPSLQRRG
jgi:transglutaminase-like putative cysteine protease